MRALAFLLLLAGCGADNEGREVAAANVQEKAAAPAAPPSAEDVALSVAAADSLRLYYRRIFERDWAGAFAIREPASGLTLGRFAANFERYQEYRATVGMPSLPARQDGAVWVQIPVQLYGRMSDGSPFGSAGAIVLKRAAGSEEWRIVG
jgi:hypothetical protein